jgi:hypothetical protein
MGNFWDDPLKDVREAVNSNPREVINWVTNPIGTATKQPLLDPIGSLRQNAVTSAAESSGTIPRQGPEFNYGDYASSRNADMLAGRARGAEIFDSPEMLAFQARKDDLSKGYSGAELGALKGQAQRDIGGQRAGYTQQLMGNLARSGVGGARAAAMRGAADVGFNRNMTDFQRKLTADNAGLIRQGEQEATDFALKRKYGGLGTEMGFAQLGVNERTAQAASAKANEKQPFDLFRPNTWFGG